jgi:hypothetical protein
VGDRLLRDMLDPGVELLAIGSRGSRLRPLAKQLRALAGNPPLNLANGPAIQPAQPPRGDHPMKIPRLPPDWVEREVQLLDAGRVGQDANRGRELADIVGEEGQREQAGGRAA